MKESESSNSSGSNEVSLSRLTFVDSQPQQSEDNLRPVPKTSARHDGILQTKSESSIGLSSSTSLFLPSLWKNGPRRSAFQPYKPSREVAAIPRVPTPPAERPASAAMTNLQRGNTTTAVSTPTPAICWFTRVGRGDLTDEQLRLMLSQGEDIDRVDDSGLSALMWASFHGQIHTVDLLLTITEKLIASGSCRGVNVNRTSMWGETALILAATEGHLEVTRLLIIAGADIDHQDHGGSTAVMCAVANDHAHTLQELLIHGADPWIHNAQNHTAYDIAVLTKAHKCKHIDTNKGSSGEKHYVYGFEQLTDRDAGIPITGFASIPLNQ